MDRTSEQPLSPKQLRDLKILIDFIHLYCGQRHAERERPEFVLPPEMAGHGRTRYRLCGECAGLALHGIQKRRRCPLDPKPTCKKCHIHCYSSDYRQKIREIMAFSGRRMVLRGRLDYLWHYLF